MTYIVGKLSIVQGCVPKELKASTENKLINK